MNPLLNMIGGNNGGNANMAALKRMMSMLKASQNPQAAFNMLAQQNPIIAQIEKDSGGDYKSYFYKLCEQKGVNPDDILKQLQN